MVDTLVAGGDHAALKGGHVLGGVEREGTPTAEGTHLGAVDGGVVCLGAVFVDI